MELPGAGAAFASFAAISFVTGTTIQVLRKKRGRTPLYNAEITEKLEPLWKNFNAPRNSG
jgi:hypothetical protein